MRFIRSRFGIVLWCAIALIIAAVPLWRLRATRQWQSPLLEIRESPSVTVIENWKPSAEFGLTNTLVQRAASDFPNDVGAQVAALEVTRFVAQSEELLPSISYREYQTQEQLARAQTDLAARTKSGWKSTDAYFARYEKLEQRFPNSKLVRAAHLHAVMFGTLKINEGPQIIYDGAELAPRTMLSLRYESWMSPRALEAAVASAQAGARLEPDNAFWPWMEAILQCSLNRNEDVLRALNAAGNKARYDDYLSSIITSRIETLKRLRATGWEDEWSEISASPDAHFYKMRSLTRAIVYQMKQSRARGDQKNAFRWGAATARASSVVARDNKTLTGKFVGEALCAITWDGAARDIAGAPAPPPQNASEAQRATYFKSREQSYVTRFAQFCRENGDEVLARQTLQTFASFDGRQLISQRSSQTNVFHARIWSLAKLYWLNSQLLRISLVTMILWGICWFLTRNFTKISPLRAQMLIPTMFFAGITGALLVAARAFVPELQTLRQILFVLEPLAPRPQPEFSIFMVAWNYSMGALWIIFAIVCAIRGTGSERDGKKESSLQFSWKLFVALVLLCCFVQSLLVSALAYSTQVDDSPSLMIQMATILLLICSFIGGVLAILWSRGQARPVAVSLACALWTVIASLMLGNESISADGSFYGEVLFFISVIFILLALFFAVKNGLFAVAKFKAFALNFAFCTRIAAGALALLCAVAYFGISLWTIPVEAHARSMMNRQLQIGEVAWLREQIAAQK